MPNIPDGYAQINTVLGLVGDNEEMMVTFGIELNAVESTDDLAIVNAMMTNFGNRFKSFMWADYRIKRVDGRINRGAGIVSISSSLAEIAGTNGNQPLPQNCAYLIHKSTAAGGRTGKGRWYLPGIPEASVDAAGNVASGTITSMNTACVDFLTDTSAVLGVNSLTLLHSLVGDIPNAITTMTLDGRIATQRRRLR